MRVPILLFLSGLASALPCADSAQASVSAAANANDGISTAIAEAARRFALPESWIRAVMRAESAGNPQAISSKGAMGLMQLMPATWANLRQTYRLGLDPFNVHDNIIAGAAFIRTLSDTYGTPGWIAAYNAGPARYEASRNGRTLPAETQAYVAIVLRSLGAGKDGRGVDAAIAPGIMWTRSPLFPARATSASMADSMQDEPHLGATPQSTGAPAPVARQSSQGGLFAMQYGQERRP